MQQAQIKHSSILQFGKHQGKTVGEVMVQDPGWLTWAHGYIHFFKLPPDLHQEAVKRVNDKLVARQQAT